MHTENIYIHVITKDMYKGELNPLKSFILANLPKPREMIKLVIIFRRYLSLNTSFNYINTKCKKDQFD